MEIAAAHQLDMQAMIDSGKPANIPGVGIDEKKDAPRYAGFNRRMIAATFDSIIVLLFVAPLIDRALQALYGPLPVDYATLMFRIGSEQDPYQLMQVVQTQIIDSGLFARWVENSFWQTAVLMVLSGVCWFFWEATPGKMILGCRVVDAKTLDPISVRQIVLRLLGYLVSGVFSFLGFFWIGFNKKRRGWHDYMAGTVVILGARK